MCDFHKLVLRPWVLVLVGVIFTTETLICLFDVLFRCGPIQIKDFVQVRRTDKHGTHEEGKKKKEWIYSHLAGLEHGQDER